MTNPENPFVFGEIIDEPGFVDRTSELSQLVRDLADGQKVFLLSPRRFGKSSLVTLALLRLKKRHIHTVNLTVSSYASYAQFLEKFAEKVLRAAGPWDRVKNWITRFGRSVKPDIHYNMTSGEVSLSLGKGQGFDPSPIAPDVLAPPGRVDQECRLSHGHLSRRISADLGIRQWLGRECDSKPGATAAGGGLCLCRVTALVDEGNALGKASLP